MLLSLQGNRSPGSLAHPSWVPYRYHKYALNHIHACNIHHYQHWYTAWYIIVIIWREELTNSFGFVLRIVQGFRLAIRVHVQIYGRLICGCSGAECLKPAVHGAKYFQATACMARISWCFCCISWCCARKVACSRFLKRCWEALTSVSEKRNTSHDIMMIILVYVDVYDMLDLQMDLHSSSPPSLCNCSCLCLGAFGLGPIKCP